MNARSRWQVLVSAAILAASAGLSTVHAQAQNAVITGQVQSDQGEILEAVNVFITELNISVGTNSAGRYTITVPGERVNGQTVQVRARFFGFVPAAQPLVLTAGNHTINFALRRDVNRLSEVVVTGMTSGTEQTKVPFSVSRVEVADLPVSAVNPLSQIQGKVAGASIVTGTGRPGAAPTVLLRGPASINASGRSQEPLFIIDGVMLTGGLPDINPQDIESVEVVKGAAAATLYGARAGNGVIQITTKSARNAADGVRFNFRSEYGLSDVEGDFGLARRHALLMDETGQLFCQTVSGQPTCSRVFDYRSEVARINNAPGFFAPPAPGFPIDPGASTAQAALRSQFQIHRWPGQTFNAVDQVVDPQPMYMYNLDMTGRLGATNVFASASHTTQGGAIRFLNGFERTSARVNVDQRVGDNWLVALRTYYGRATADGGNQENSNNAFFRLTRVPAISNILATDTLGRLHIRPNLQNSGAQNENPLWSLQNSRREDVSTRFIGGANVRYTPFSWLDFETQLSYDGADETRTTFQDKGFRTTQSNPTTNLGNIIKIADKAESYSANLNATARRDFLDGDLAARLSGGYLYSRQDYQLRDGRGNTLAVQGITSLDNSTRNQQIDSDETSVRQLGWFTGVNLELKERYIVDALIRGDGSSLFGENERWATFGRVSGAWRLSQEPWWFIPQANEFKLRASYGTAGNRPNFTAQYETFTIGTGGVVSPVQLGNRNLKRELVGEIELGADIELFNRFGLNATYAQSETKDQILPVLVPSATGFTTQWQNAGTLETKTWELSLNIPILERRDLSWSARVIYDRSRTVITALDVPPFAFGATQQATETIFRAQVGERYGTFYGRKFATSCAELPDAFRGSCGGSNTAFQFNDEGFLVWVGEGNSWRDGITRNLWQASLAGSEAPWGVGLNWGMPIILRDDSQSALQLPLGNALPDFRFAVSQNFSWKRLNVYALLDASIGQDVWNQGRHWAHLDFLAREIDQDGKSVETAKPIGYYWRAGPPDQTGLQGFYDILAPNNRFVEDASYAKLREASVEYRIGPIRGVGNWAVSLVGRNLFTITDYKGFDPEVGIGPQTRTSNVGGQSNSAAINAVDAFSFPNLRSFTFGLSTSF